jgi:hypothetical protein
LMKAPVLAVLPAVAAAAAAAESSRAGSCRQQVAALNVHPGRAYLATMED